MDTGYHDALKTFLNRLSLATVVGALGLALLAAPVRAQDSTSNSDTETSENSEDQEETLEQKVLGIFETRCASCHSEKKEGNFDFVLDLKRLINTPKYIIAGKPDLSYLMQRIDTDTMPAGGEPKLPEEEREFVRQWIEDSQTVREQQAAKRRKKQKGVISHDDLVEAIKDDLDQLEERSVDVASFRYFTLHNLYNAGDTNAEMKLWRSGIRKAVNSVSWHGRIAKLEVVKSRKTKGTLLRVDLRDLKWDPVVWDRLLSIYPYGTKPKLRSERSINEALDTPQPYVRADWFTFYATRPPLYHELLGLPKNSRILEQKIVKVDVARNLRRGEIQRAGFRISGVSNNNRVIERHEIKDWTGAYWKSYDFAGNAGHQDIFRYPAGPGKGKDKFKHDGGEIIFNLPNGMQAYYLETEDGNRIDEGPVTIVRDKTRPDRPQITNGVSCMGCHKDGMIMTPDQVRSWIESDFSIEEEELDRLLSIYVKYDEMKDLFFQDMKRYLTALKEADALKALEFSGDGEPRPVRHVDTESVLSLADRYEERLTILQAASEIGLTPKKFERRLNASFDRVTKQIGLELARGTMPRDTFETAYPAVMKNMLRRTVLNHVAHCGKRLRRYGEFTGIRQPSISTCERTGVFARLNLGDPAQYDDDSKNGSATSSNSGSSKKDKRKAALKLALTCDKAIGNIGNDVEEYGARVKCFEAYLSKHKDQAVQKTVQRYSGKLKVAMAEAEQAATSQNREQRVLNLAISCDEASEGIADPATRYKRKIECYANYRTAYDADPAVIEAISDYELKYTAALNAKQVAQVKQHPFQGAYDAWRGYTSKSRPKPYSECLSQYGPFAVNIDGDGVLEFHIEGRTIRGFVDMSGKMRVNGRTTDWVKNKKIGLIQGRRFKSRFTIDGNLSNARMVSGYCRGGFFRMTKR